MPVEFRIDTEERTIYAAIRGDLDIDEVLAGLADIISHEEFKPGMNGIFDFTASDWESNPDELRKVIQFMIENRDRIGKSRSALFVGSERSYGMSRMFEVFSEETSIELRVFRNYEAAKKWILEPPEEE